MKYSENNHHKRKASRTAFYRLQLEKAVGQRTSQLKRINKRLQNEAAQKYKSEMKLYHACMLLEKVFASLDQAVFVIKPVSRTIVQCNEAVERIFGYKKEEVVGRNTEFLHVDHQLYEEFGRDLFKVLDKEGVFKCEYKMKRKDGAVFYSEHTVTEIVDDKGNRTGVVSVIRDITERKQLEEQLRHAQKMESVGLLSGGIAHDFNNTLTAIVGFGNLILKKKGDDELIRHYIERILSAAKNTTSVVQQLLAFGRRQHPVRQLIDVNNLVKSIGRMLERLIAENIELRIQCSAAPITIEADSTLIEQVLMNLATNSRDAMPNGGCLTVQVDRVELDQNFIETHGFGRPGSYASILFSDTGSGMDNAVREKIFDPFFTTKEMGRGTGLGLSMAYGAIKDHNGFIDVESEVGKGTTFRIFIPATEQNTDKEEVRPTFCPVHGGQETLLLAEDDEMVLESTKAILEDCGYRVITAVDGEDAVAKYGENMEKIGLVICDIVMPKMCGREVFEALRGINPWIKMLFVTGYTGETVNSMFEEEIEFVSKPIFPDILLEKVREVIDR